MLAMEKHTVNKPCVKCGGTNRYPAPPKRKLGQCIDCQNARYQKNKDHILKNVDKWQKENQDKVLKIKNNWKKQNIEKIKAHNEVLYAIKKERLIPVSKCMCLDCGASAKEYHHEDYSKPLDVIPLCYCCHKNRHKSKKNL